MVSIPIGMIQEDRRYNFTSFRDFSGIGVKSSPESRNHLGEPVNAFKECLQSTS